MNDTDAAAAEIFRALADPVRRAVYERLSGGSRNATELRQGFAISQPAMSQHLGVLRAAGLIREQRAGRHVNYSIDPEGLGPLSAWLDRYARFWPERIGRLQDVLKEMDQ